MSAQDPDEKLVPFVDDASADAELRSLFASARADRPAVDLDAITRSARPTPSAPRWPMRLVGVGVVVIGVAIAWQARPAPPERVIASPPPREVLAVPTPAPQPIEIAPEAEAPAIAPVTTVRPRAAPRPSDTSEGSLREGTLLLRARRALAAGDASAALEAVATHEREFPHGTLESEREVLGIQALSALGENERASTRARRFMARFPASPYREQVERVLAADAIP